MSDWIKTDDLQFLRKTGEKEYELAEVRYGNYIVQGMITVPDISQKFLLERMYQNYIRYYYSSLDEFLESYPDKEDREQVLAEIIFESVPISQLKYQFVPEEEAEDILMNICV